MMYQKEVTDGLINSDTDSKKYIIPSEADFFMVWSLVPGNWTILIFKAFVKTESDVLGQTQVLVDFIRL